jgi:hypothetical protein
MAADATGDIDCYGDRRSAIHLQAHSRFGFSKNKLHKAIRLTDFLTAIAKHVSFRLPQIGQLKDKELFLLVHPPLVLNPRIDVLVRLRAWAFGRVTYK